MQWRAQVIACVLVVAFVAVATAARLWLERGRLQGVAQHFIRLWRACSQLRAEPDPFEQRVQEACRERRLERARDLLVLAGITAVLVEPYVFLTMLAEESTMLLATHLLIPFFTGVCLLFSLSSKLFTHRVIDITSFLSIVALAAMAIMPKMSVSVVVGHRAQIMGGALFWCLLSLRPGVNAVWLLTVHAPLIVRAKLDDEPLAGLFVSLTLSCVVLLWIDFLHTKSVRFEIRATDSGKELSAVKVLLGTICDLVVELDSSFRLMQHSPGLAVILLRGSGRSLKGARLQDFLFDDEDQQALEESLGGSEEALQRGLGDEEDVAAAADVFHAKMRDSSDSGISMEFFSVAFKGHDNGRRHLVGIREFTDVPPVNKPLQSRWALASTPTTVEGGGAAAQPAAAAGTGSAGGASEASLSGSEASGRRRLAECPRRETTHAAKKISLTYVLLGWHVPGLESTCCPMHAVLTDLQGVVRDMSSGGCNRAFWPNSRWQCGRCGIATEAHRPRMRKAECHLCSGVPDAQLNHRPRGEPDMLAL